MTDEVALDTEVTPPQEENVPQNDSQEKMLPVSRVEELVKKAKLKGRDSMQAELEALKAENTALKSGQMGGMAAAPAAVDHNAIAAQVMQSVQEQMQKAAMERAKADQEAEGQRVANSFKSKMSTGGSQIEDFDTVMSDFNPGAFPNLVYLAERLDNVPAVMYELKKNPMKLASIALMSERDPQAAIGMLNDLSTSIKANQQAKADAGNDTTPPPITRLSSSNTGQDTGKKTVRDWKKIYRR